MRLSLLEKREDVLTVLVESLNQFFSEYFPNAEVNASIKPNDGITFYGNKYLNFFASESVIPDAFTVIINEYAQTKVWWRSVLQYVYVHFAIKSFFFKWHHHYKFYIKAPSESEISSWLFMGGNTRVRILNHDNNETIIILKEGYDISFISNEIEFRRSIEHFLVPTIHDIGKRFIVESLHPGVPINRLKYSAIKKYRLKAFSVFLRDIVFPRREYSKEYYDSLVGDVIRLLKIYIKQGPRTNLHIDFLEGACNIEDSAMIISTSHGDFQDANIILAEEGLKIIDWEAVDRRSITYDFITLFAQTRVSFPSVDQLQDLIEGQLFNSFFGEYEVQNNRETYLIVFLLEELLYQLRYSLLTSRGIQEENLKIDKLLSYLNGGFQRVA